MYKESLKRINLTEHKEKIEDIIEMLMCEIKDIDKESYEYVCNELYELAYGKKISDEMADKWVNALVPRAKWTKEEVISVSNSYGLSQIPINCLYVLMNMLYSDNSKVYGSGDDTESIERYIQGVKDWFFDQDLKIDGEEKLYNYYKYIFKAKE